MEMDKEVTGQFLDALKIVVEIILRDNLEIKLDKSRGEIEARLELFGEIISTDRIYL